MTLRHVLNLLIREGFWQVMTVHFKLVSVRVCVENFFGPRGDEFIYNKQHLVWFPAYTLTMQIIPCVIVKAVKIIYSIFLCWT